jgi:hypothetical protein
MWEEIIQKVKAAVEADVVNRFGLNDEQASQTGNIVTDNLRKLFSEDLLQKDFDLQGLVSHFNDPEKNPLLRKLNSGLLEDLVQKANLPPDIAEKVKEFSGQQLLEKVKENFLGPDGKPDLQKIMQQVDMKQMQQIARAMMGKLGGMFERN